MGWPRGTLLIWMLALLVGCGPTVDAPDAPSSITRQVILTNVGDARDAALEALRSEAGLTLVEAEALLESLPSVVATGLSHEEADRMSRALVEAGMTTRVQKDGAR